MTDSTTTTEEPQNVSVDGSVAAGFEGVREAFAENFSRRGDLGAALTVYVDGNEVVNLWGGNADASTPWREDTLACGMSTVKPVLAAAVAVLADRGVLDVDTPIAEYWPEFAAAGKERLTLAHVLTHTSGLPSWEGEAEIATFDDPASFADLEGLAAGLAGAAPQWEPGTTLASHSLSVGWLLAETVRRASGREIAEVVRTEIVEPLGGDCWIGLPLEQQARAAEMVADAQYDSDELAAFMNPDTPAGKAMFLGPQRRLGTALSSATNDPAYRTNPNPAVNSFVTPRTLARVYAMLLNGGELDGKRILSPDRVEDHTRVRFEGEDAIFSVGLRLSLGFLHTSRSTRYLDDSEGFGFAGQGGQLAFADPDHRVAFAYLPRSIAFLGPDGDPRANALVAATQAAVEARDSSRG
jgi:CubicO group peptidase (beta-lactamase class C family)